MKISLLLVNVLVFASATFAQTARPDWEAKLLKMYPELAIAGSSLNTKFNKLIEERKRSNPDFFKNRNWPFLIAAEADAPVAVAPAPNAPAPQPLGKPTPAPLPELAKAGNPQPPAAPAAPRKYTQMTPKETENFAREKILNREPPYPVNIPVKFTIPEKEPYTSGIKLNENGNIVFAILDKWPAMAFFPRRNISTLLPIVDRQDIMPLVSPEMAVRASAVPTDLGFRGYAAFWTTTDIVVVDRPLLIYNARGWSNESRIIKRGAYVWHLNAVGVCLTTLQGGDSFVIPFDAPHKDIISWEDQKPILIKYNLSAANGGVDVIRIGCDEMPGISFTVKPAN